MAVTTKTLKPEVYRELKDIVGTEYISEEPAILDGYCFVWGNELFFEGDKFSTRPLAVVLPGSTEELQAIVKVCNKYGIKFRPHASAFEVIALTAPEPFLPIDLRRMNRILKIDENNMYAVVEPYVSQVKLNLETIKKGLRPSSYGAGGSISMIAATCCHFGSGTTNVSAGYGGCVVLGVEWILPDGSLLELGSLGSGAGWFTGDGPGPSLRGVMRGYSGPGGGLGIITKAAIRLVPWYGPSKVETKGVAPNYEMQIPDNMRIYTITFPNNDKLFEAMQLMCEEKGFAYALSRRGPFTTAAGMAGSTKELKEIWENGLYQEKAGHIALLIIDGSSKRELKYKEKYLQKILEQTQGEILPELNDPRSNCHRFGYAFIGLGCVKSVFKSGGFFVAPIGEEALDLISNVKKEGVQLKEEYAKKGHVLDDGDPTWVTPYNENSIGSHAEVVFRYDPLDSEAIKGVGQLIDRTKKLTLEKKLGIAGLEGAFSYCDDIHDMFGPECLNYDVWMRKIRTAFDPNSSAESSWYISPEK